MKHWMRVIAIAVAANFAAFGMQPASAIDAHHPAKQTTKGKKAKKLAPNTKAKSTKRARMQMMKRPMMNRASMHGIGMKQGVGSQMGPHAMHSRVPREEK